MTTTVTHIAGVAIRFGSHRRQRCSWCGYVIEDVDLDRIAMPICGRYVDRDLEQHCAREAGHSGDCSVKQQPGDFTLPEWPFESLLEITTDGGSRMTTVIDFDSLEHHEDGSVKVPENCCLRVPAELTLEVGKCLNSVP